ncbi:MAG: S-adenosylmethionine:tRNA ribosyltransferase-isomerase [Gemmatimonadales bacterium]
MTTLTAGIDFELPDALAAHEPPEVRGLSRDSVRLMISRVHDDEIVHSTFSHLPDFLDAGDVVVVNSSATINAAFGAIRKTRSEAHNPVWLHLSAPLGGLRWVVELRQTTLKGSVALLDADAGETLSLPGGAKARLIEPYAEVHSLTGGVRLWIAELSLSMNALTYSDRYGSPIRYSYVPQRWPLSYYQTIFADEPGSAEMPSAGRPFSREVVARLEEKGVRVVPLILHTGVSSLDSDEDPYPERYRVPLETARVVNEARSAHARIVAVGTTVVRALETAASLDGTVRESEGWTDLVITPEHGVGVVDAMLTGFHAPKASHLSMLEALAGHDHLSRAYSEAVQTGYAWHEFGDVHLILP